MRATPVGNEAMPICSRSTFDKYVSEQNMDVEEDDDGGGTIGDFDDQGDTESKSSPESPPPNEGPVPPVYEGNLETAEGRRAFYSSLTPKDRQAWYKMNWDLMLDWATIYAGRGGLIE
jgi:hypothetical protein